MVVCRLCGAKVQDIGIHLREYHFMSYSEYYETYKEVLLEDLICWKCGSNCHPISPLFPDIPAPCLNCIESLSASGLEDRRQSLFRSIQDYQVQIGKSRYIQFLLSLSDLSCIYPRDILKVSHILSSLKKKFRLKLERNSLLSLDSLPGSKYELSERNFDNLILGEDNISVFNDLEISLGSSNYRIVLPEIIPFDTKHHSRHSILNPGARRSSKRLRMRGNESECVKFYGSSFVKSIFKLVDKDGIIISFSTLSEVDQEKVRQVILSTKVTREILFSIYNEIISYTELLVDGVLLKNTIQIPSSKNLHLYFTWSESELPEGVQEIGENIKLTVLC